MDLIRHADECGATTEMNEEISMTQSSSQTWFSKSSYSHQGVFTEITFNTRTADPRTTQSRVFSWQEHVSDPHTFSPGIRSRSHLIRGPTLPRLLVPLPAVTDNYFYRSRSSVKSKTFHSDEVGTRHLVSMRVWVVRNGAEGPFRTFQERILADTIQNVLLFKADVTYT